MDLPTYWYTVPYLKRELRYLSAHTNMTWQTPSTYVYHTLGTVSVSGTVITFSHIPIVRAPCISIENDNSSMLDIYGMVGYTSTGLEPPTDLTQKLCAIPKWRAYIWGGGGEKAGSSPVRVLWRSAGEGGVLFRYTVLRRRGAMVLCQEREGEGVSHMGGGGEVTTRFRGLDLGLPEIFLHCRYGTPVIQAQPTHPPHYQVPVPTISHLRYEAHKILKIFHNQQ
jgi:hypothetical protein